MPLPILVLLCAFVVAACDSQPISPTTGSAQSTRDEDLVTYTEDREACADRNANRNAYFGDLHIHTGFSYDTFPLGTRTTPADAYRFARGEPLAIPPYDESGRPLAQMQLKRPLDFAAVTDHSEFFGELSLCSDTSSDVYEHPTCELFRSGGGEGMWPFIKVVLMKDPARIEEICGDDGTACWDASISLWKTTKEMAEEAYDRSSRCAFTTFVGYEHTGTPDANNYHRNVIFRNAKVPERAISYIETPTDHELWEQLAAQCLDGLPGCDVLAIPHNSNLSSGSMFPSYVAGFESRESARQMAELRNAMEPVMEIFQHKGNSECFNGFPDILGDVDELCEVEQVRAVGERADASGERFVVRICEDEEIGRRGFSGIGCISKNDFYRSVLLTGLKDEALIGINSYKFGAIASTDTHLSLAGATDEAGWQGHLVDETELTLRLQKLSTSARRLDANPGGLAGIWAVENSRDALFEALRSREVFGTTGTRIQPRLFAGWDLDANACNRDDKVEHGYATGVPMGGDFPAGTPNANPKLLASAVRDPDGAPLQKLQIVKGWIDSAGQAHYQVLDVAGHDSKDGAVDLATGQWSGKGSASLCTVFEDATFVATEPAYYYLRVVEVPTLRWNWAQCAALPIDQRPAECDNDAPKSIQELAWTSPIWYLPPREEPGS